MPTAGIPLFSAAHADRFQIETGRDWPENKGQRWRRVRVKDDKMQWGYYLELAPAVFDDGDGDAGPDPQTSNLPTESKKMAVKTHTWISLWFLLTAPVIMWDVGYCFMRPRSMAGGDLHWIWQPYEIYQEVDYVYGVKALQENNGFTNAQSLLNVIETFLNLTYLYLAHVAAWPPATLVGFAAAVMTLSKTVLYWAQEYYCGGCAIGHNTAKDLLVYWIIPNGLWIVFPAIISVRLGKDLAVALTVASQSSKKAELGKTR